MHMALDPDKLPLLWPALAAFGEKARHVLAALVAPGDELAPREAAIPGGRVLQARQLNRTVQGAVGFALAPERAEYLAKMAPVEDVAGLTAQLLLEQREVRRCLTC
jgi:hypothetical protein